MKFRYHSGSLSESMTKQIEVNDMNELKANLEEFYKYCASRIEEIKFKYCGFDKRTGWNTYYVLVRFEGLEDFTVSGMSDSEFKIK